MTKAQMHECRLEHKQHRTIGVTKERASHVMPSEMLASYEAVS